MIVVKNLSRNVFNVDHEFDQICYVLEIAILKIFITKSSNFENCKIDWNLINLEIDLNEIFTQMFNDQHFLTRPDPVPGRMHIR